MRSSQAVARKPWECKPGASDKLQLVRSRPTSLALAGRSCLLLLPDPLLFSKALAPFSPSSCLLLQMRHILSRRDQTHYTLPSIFASLVLACSHHLSSSSSSSSFERDSHCSIDIHQTCIAPSYFNFITLHTLHTLPSIFASLAPACNHHLRHFRLRDALRIVQIISINCASHLAPQIYFITHRHTRSTQIS